MDYFHNLFSYQIFMLEEFEVLNVMLLECFD
jgi:hypothetical protein